MKLLIPFFLLFFFSGCFDGEGRLIRPKTLFSIGIGALEDELRHFVYGPDAPDLLTDFIYHQGLFYVSNTQGQKIMVFTSHGVLLRSWFNPISNPTPYDIPVIDDAGQQTTRYARPFGFIRPTLLAVSENNDLLVVDSVSTRDRLLDEGNNRILDKVVLRFDGAGLFKDQLGLEGVGGRPLPHIIEIKSLKNNRLGVISREREGYEIRFFSSEGQRDMVLQVREEELKDFLNFPEVIIPSIDRILLDKGGDSFFIKLTLFRKNIDPGTLVVNNIITDEIKILRFSTATGEFMGDISVPLLRGPSPGRILNGNEGMVDYPMELLGQTEKGLFVLITTSIPGILKVVTLDFQGRVLWEGDLELDPEVQEIVNFHLAGDGRIFGMVSDGYSVDFLLWDIASKIGHLDGKTR